MQICGSRRLAASTSPFSSASSRRPKPPTGSILISAGAILGPSNSRIRPDVDRVPRDAVRVGHELAHAGARVAHAAPRARVADGLGPFQKRLILRSGLVAPAPRFHLTEINVPHHFGIEALLAEVAFLERDPLVQPHAGGEDTDLRGGVHHNWATVIRRTEACQSR